MINEKELWKNWNFWNGRFSNKVEKFHKISFCTTCMDRLYTLKECLPKNIEDNRHYPNLEFVVLDYNGKDGVGHWIKKNMMHHIESGLLNYYRTDEPQYYSMSHSRNVAFKLAQGEIVNNVDADNFAQKGFASYLNFLAAQRPKKAVFVKSKRLMNGRFGMYKDEFLEIGGYDETLQGYGYDDKNILIRAMESDHMMMWYCGMFQDRIKTPRSAVGQNMENPNWRETEKINKQITTDNLAAGKIIANEGVHWGKATVIKNFKEEVSI